ncbi:MAG: rod shape-determining protein [Paludibacteraceae bacterium]|nr:rod shape-determining protein [Paludibacteraceae bacterium]
MPKKIITHATTDLPLVAVEVGSNNIRAMAAEKVGEDMLHIIGYEEYVNEPCVDRGVVVRSDDAGFAIDHSLHLLANRIGVETILSAYTLIGGKGMQIIEVRAKRDQIRKKPISEALKQELRKECYDKIEQGNAEAAVFDLVLSYYVLDGVEVDHEVDEKYTAALVEAHYTAFVGYKKGLDKLNESFEHAKISLEKLFVRPDALFSALSAGSNDVLANGCAILDMGAQTTTLTIYKGNQYLLNKVVAQGGWHISRFIEQQGISFEYAEYIKCHFGQASPAYIERDQQMAIPSNRAGEGNTHIKLTELAAYIELKLNEILQPLLAALQPFEERISCLYLTGGASMLNGFPQWLQSQVSIPVKYGSHAYLLDRNTDDEFCKPRYASLVGALIMGADWRDKHPQQVVPDNKSFKSRVEVAKQSFIDFFSGADSKIDY